jgi:hypothetical protein
VAGENWSCLHWAVSGGHAGVVQLLADAGEAQGAGERWVDCVDTLGQTPMQTAILGHQDECIRVLAEHGADLGYTASNGLLLLDYGMLLSNREHRCRVVRVLIELGCKVDMDIITRSVGKRLTFVQDMLMHAYIKSRGLVPHKVVSFIQRYYEEPAGRFDDCILHSPSPLWSCLVVCDVLEKAASASVSQRALYASLLATYVEKATSICKVGVL